jgi:hypothetical protein
MVKIHTMHYQMLEKRPTICTDCTTPLFYILATTCFGSSLPSLGSLLDPPEVLEIQIGWAVYHIKWGYVTCVLQCVAPSVVSPNQQPVRRTQDRYSQCIWPGWGLGGQSF